MRDRLDAIRTIANASHSPTDKKMFKNNKKYRNQYKIKCYRQKRSVQLDP